MSKNGSILSNELKEYPCVFPSTEHVESSVRGKNVNLVMIDDYTQNAAPQEDGPIPPNGYKLLNDKSNYRLKANDYFYHHNRWQFVQNMGVFIGWQATGFDYVAIKDENPSPKFPCDKPWPFGY